MAYNSEVPGTMIDRWMFHLEKMAVLSEKHGSPQPSGDFAKFAEELDDFFCRQHGIE